MALTGKIAAITASTKGIGLACAEKFLKEGAIVYISSRRQQAVDKEINRLNKTFPNKIFGTACHVSDYEQRTNLKNLIESNHGKLDILVSNAANNNYFGPTVLCPKKSWDKIFDVNVVSAAMLIQEFLPLLESANQSANSGAKSGTQSNITCISSIVASTKTDMLGPYSVSKAALSALVRQLSRELAAKNIRINSVEPGVVKTDFATVLHDPKSPYSKMLDNFDMKRAGEPEEIANLVKFLSSEEASFITGESHRICGGSPGW